MMKILSAERSSRRDGGFTLVEVVAASVIGAFIALVAFGALKTVSVSAERVEGNIEASAELRFATRYIATDLANIYRDTDAGQTKFAAWFEEGIDVDMPVFRLVFYITGRTKARPGQQEGDVYEVEYFISQNEETNMLMRRLWPNPGNSDEAVPGGVITKIAEDIEFFGIRFFDGAEWLDEWPMELEGQPQILEVNIVAGKDRDKMFQSFMVNLLGTKEGSADAVGGDDESSGSGQEGLDED